MSSQPSPARASARSRRLRVPVQHQPRVDAGEPERHEACARLEPEPRAARPRSRPARPRPRRRSGSSCRPSPSPRARTPAAARPAPPRRCRAAASRRPRTACPRAGSSPRRARSRSAKRPSSDRRPAPAGATRASTRRAPRARGPTPSAISSAEIPCGTISQRSSSLSERSPPFEPIGTRDIDSTPGGDDEVELARPDRGGRVEVALHRRAALPVDGRPRTDVRPAGDERRHPPDVPALLADLRDAAHLHVLDLGRVELVPGEEPVQHLPGELVRAQASTSVPFRLPIGVRTASTIRASTIVHSVFAVARLRATQTPRLDGMATTVDRAQGARRRRVGRDGRVDRGSLALLRRGRRPRRQGRRGTRRSARSTPPSRRCASRSRPTGARRSWSRVVAGLARRHDEVARPISRRGRQAAQGRAGRGLARDVHVHLRRGRGAQARRRDGADGRGAGRRGQARVHAARSRSGSSARSRRSTSRSTSSRTSSLPRSPPAARWCSSLRATTPLSALLLAELEEEAGLPPGWLNVVVGPSAEIGDVLVEDERVKAITFTGSGPVGWEPARSARRRSGSTSSSATRRR